MSKAEATKSRNPQKIEKITLSDKVEHSMIDMIQKGEWTNGQKLPSESELADSFGVSRLTVRLALQKLNAKGLIVTRSGEGSFIQKFSLSSYMEEVSDLYVTPKMLDDVAEFRKVLEVEALRLACKNATEKDFDRMQKCCDTYLEILLSTGDSTEESFIKRRVEADLEFHKSLCKASHNSLFVVAFNAAQGAIRQHLTSIVTKRSSLHSISDISFTGGGKEIHRYILDSIREKNFEKCREAYYTHIDHHLEVVEYVQKVKEVK